MTRRERSCWGSRRKNSATFARLGHAAQARQSRTLASLPYLSMQRLAARFRRSFNGLVPPQARSIAQVRRCIETLLKQDLHIHVILFWFQHPAEEKVNIALAKIMIVQHDFVAEPDSKHDPRAVCVPKIRFGNTGGEVHRGSAVKRWFRRSQSADGLGRPCSKNDASAIHYSSARRIAGSGVSAPRRPR